MSHCNAFILSNYPGGAMCNVQLPINFSVAIPKDRGLCFVKMLPFYLQSRTNSLPRRDRLGGHNGGGGRDLSLSRLGGGGGFYNGQPPTAAHWTDSLPRRDFYHTQLQPHPAGGGISHQQVSTFTFFHIFFITFIKVIQVQKKIASMPFDFIT